MHITVTRLGGRSLRVSVAAIAYVDETADGAVVKLIGGEGVRVTEDRETVEQLLDATQPALAEAVLVSGPAREMVAGDIDAPAPVAPAKPQPRGKRA